MEIERPTPYDWNTACIIEQFIEEYDDPDTTYEWDPIRQSPLFQHDTDRSNSECDCSPYITTTAGRAHSAIDSM